MFKQKLPELPELQTTDNLNIPDLQPEKNKRRQILRKEYWRKLGKDEQDLG